MGEVKLPDFIKDAPDLYFWLAPYYDAFGELSTCRPVDTFSGSIGRIPWTAMNEYTKRHEFFDQDFERFIFYINVLDQKLIQLVKDTKPKDKLGQDRKPFSPGSRKNLGRGK